MGLDSAPQHSKEDFRVLCEQTITAILFGSKWSCLLLRNVLQDALSEVMKLYAPLKLKVFVYDTAFMEGRHKELPGVAEKGGGRR